MDTHLRLYRHCTVVVLRLGVTLFSRLAAPRCPLGVALVRVVIHAGFGWLFLAISQPRHEHLLYLANLSSTDKDSEIWREEYRPEQGNYSRDVILLN